MEKFSFTVSAVFSSDKSITFELIPEAVAFLRANGCLAEGKTKGSWGMAPDGKTMEIRPYAQADPVRKIVKDEEKVGAFHLDYAVGLGQKNTRTYGFTRKCG